LSASQDNARGAQNTPQSRLNSRGALDRLRVGCMELNRHCVLSHTARRGRGRCTPSDDRRLGGRFAHDQRVSEEDHCQDADRAFRNCMRARGREVKPGAGRHDRAFWRRLVLRAVTLQTGSIYQRERVTIRGDSIGRVLHVLRASGSAEEWLVLSTCGRTEVYAVTRGILDLAMPRQVDPNAASVPGIRLVTLEPLGVCAEPRDTIAIRRRQGRRANRGGGACSHVGLVTSRAAHRVAAQYLDPCSAPPASRDTVHAWRHTRWETSRERRPSFLAIDDTPFGPRVALGQAGATTRSMERRHSTNSAPCARMHINRDGSSH
jgi:hypothetical protein